MMVLIFFDNYVIYNLIIVIIIIIIIFNKRIGEARVAEASLLNNSSCLAPALGMTKFTNERLMILVNLFCVT